MVNVCVIVTIVPVMFVSGAMGLKFCMLRLCLCCRKWGAHGACVMAILSGTRMHANTNVFVIEEWSNGAWNVVLLTFGV